MVRRQLPVTALITGLAILVVKVAASTPRLSSEAPLVAITWLTVVSFILIGWLLLRTDVPPVNGWACLLVAAGTIPGDFNSRSYDATGLTATGAILEYSYLAAAIALVLRYPRARLERSERWSVGLLVLMAIGWRIPTLLTTGRRTDGFYGEVPWHRWALPAVWHDWVFAGAGRAGVALVLFTVAGWLLHRVVTTAGLSKQSMLPLAVVGAVCALAAGVDQLSWLVGLSRFSWAPAMVRDLSGAAIPVALLADLLQRQTAAALIGTRVLLAAREGDAADLQGALRDALADPSLLVVVRTVDGSPVGVDGRGPSTSHRPAARLEVRGSHSRFLCELFYDPHAVRDQNLLQSAADTVRVGLENTHLNADLLASRAAVEDSRARIIEAGLAERRRLERDLHDGAQQQFLAVAATLAGASFAQSPQDLQRIADNAGAQLRDALAELRRLARGIHPATLTQAGLGPALVSLAEVSPIPVELHLHDNVRIGRQASVIESSAYFVAAEALTNAVKHSEATRIRVDVHLADDVLVLAVSDDGIGGATLRPGGGLSGLADRIQALNGTLTLSPEHPQWSGARTRVLARLPLEHPGDTS